MKTAERGMEVYIRQTVPDTYRLVMKEIRQKEIYNLIIDTNPKDINKFFRSVITNRIQKIADTVSNFNLF